MGLRDTVSWYQRKIGKYDKQQWEKTVEQRILAGFKHVLKKTAKLKTDLIDVDLVRGSSFAKAKPKHGFATVTKFAIVRWMFLPFFWSWWIQQTCIATFSLLLFLYSLQIVNILFYFYFSTLPVKLLERVSAYEVIVPAAMMLVLSLVHSEIVATSSGRPAELYRSKRGRRTQRRTDRVDKSRHQSDSETEELTLHTVRFPNGVADDTPEGCERQQENVLRRRNVGGREVVPPQPTNAAEDDGFESLNSHGSSEDVPGLQGAKPNADLNAEPDANPRSAWLSGLGRPRGRGQNNVHFTDTDSELDDVQGSPQRILSRRRPSKTLPVIKHEDYDSSDESESPLTPREPRELGAKERGMMVREGGRERSAKSCSRVTPGVASGSEWLGVTTNSEECSVSSDVDSCAGDSSSRQLDDHPFAWEFQMSPSSTISPSCASSDRVSCTIWEDRELKRADLSVLDISSAIIARVESMPENIDYFYGGLCAAVVMSLLPSLCRLIDVVDGERVEDSLPAFPAVEVQVLSCFQRLYQLIDVTLGTTALERFVIISAAIERFFLASLFFFLAAVAERTLKQRFLYAKLFSQLTSFRRARRSHLPHFRLNKVRNIKTWLSVRSYLKKRGPQRSVDVIVSAAFIITLLLLSFITVELLKNDYQGVGGHIGEVIIDSARLHSEYNLEALVWCLALGVFLLRFMTLGNKTNRKYRNLSVLLTEQINLYLQIEQKPNKKEELMVANSVLKLAADLLKELESPFKMSGLSTNPYLYTITKVVILSALSGVLSEMLGFKLKLHNIKISSIK